MKAKSLPGAGNPLAFLLVLSGVCLGLSACKDKTASPSAPPKPEPVPPPSTVVAPPTVLPPDAAQPGNAAVAPPAPPKPLPQASPEQMASVLRVRVVAGGLPVGNFAGALLHRSEVPNEGDYFDKHRCVLAMLKGFTEAQLRGGNGTISVFRNLPSPDGTIKPAAYSGRLAKFDPQTGIAAITYSQGFSAETEVGFKIGREPARDLSGIALRFVTAPGEMSPVPVVNPEWGYSSVPPGSRIFPPMTLVTGAFSATGAGSGAIKFEEYPGKTGDDSPLVTSSPSVLNGFLRENDGGTATMVPVRPFTAPLGFLTVKPVQVGFREDGGSSVRAQVSVETVGGEKMPRLYLNMEKLELGRKVDLAALKEPFATISPSRGRTYPPAAMQKQIEASLPAPSQNGEVVVYMLQLAWREFDEDPGPSRFSRPFLVKLVRNGGVLATTEDITNLNEVKPEADGATTPFPMEAPVIGVFEMAGGREILMQLQGDPFWKRFSMEKKDWLPLPPVDLSTVDLAGNRSSIFVLDRGAAEVRKYNLSDLNLTGSGKLDGAGKQFLAIRAGCNSDRAPVYVQSSLDVICLDANTLARKDVQKATNQRSQLKFSKGFRCTGDGMTLVTESDSPFGAEASTYAGDYVGLREGYLDAGDKSERDQRSGASISGAFSSSKKGIFSCANPLGEWVQLPGPPSALLSRNTVIPNAPILVRLAAGDESVIPPNPPRLQLFSFFDVEALAEVKVPELAGVISKYNEQQASSHRVCFDPLSKRVGILTRDQKTWIVKEVTMDANRQQPVMLNWPETSVTRGGEFRFAPLMLGDGRLAGELLGTKEPTALKVDEKGLSFQLAGNELASLILLTVKIAGADGKAISYPIPVHVQGAPAALVGTELNPGTDPDWFAAGFKTLTSPKGKRKGLDTTFYASPDPVKAVYGPIRGHLALLTDARRMDFLSIATRKVAGSLAIPEKASYYPGCGALFEYDLSTRTLTRISVPEGRREQSLNFPARFELMGLGLGTEREQPLTLVIERKEGEQSNQVGNLTVTTWQSNRTIVALNSETLVASPWMQPVSLSDKPQESNFQAIAPLLGSGPPKRIVGSRNGSLLILRDHLLVLTPNYSVIAPYPGAKKFGSDDYVGEGASGSITGLIATKGSSVFRNGLAQQAPGGGSTPCGRYQIVALERSGPNSSGSRSPGFEVRSLEGGLPIFRVNRLAALQVDFDSSSAVVPRLLQDGGPLLVCSQGGRLLQFIDFDISRLAQEVNPGKVHVTSQPIPCVVEGGTFEYAIQTNNPAAVTGYKLRNKIPNAMISPTGVLRFPTPQNVRVPLQVDVSVEIVGQDGKTLLHDFPILVLPRKLPAQPMSPRGGMKKAF